MLKLLKKLFIPHHHNDHKPHILRAYSVTIVIISVVMVEALFLSQAIPFLTHKSFTAIVLPKVLVDQTNTERGQSNLGAVTINDKLVLAAQMKANDMAEKGYFAHTTPDGKTPWYWLNQADYNFKSAGENLAINYTDSIDVTNAWMNSPTHRANIMKSDFKEIGIATAQGTYKGQPAVFVVQFFGTQNIATANVANNVAKIAPAVATSTVASTATSTAKLAVKTPVAIKAPVKAPVTASTSVLATSAPITAIPTTITTTSSTEQVRVLGEEIEPAATYSTRFEKWLSNPSHTLTIFLSAIAMIFAIALLLKVFIKMKIHHPMLLINGVVAIVIILALISLNVYLQSLASVV